MHVPAGEIDRGKSAADLITYEFERFHQLLQKHYGADYPEEGFFEETTASPVVHESLRNLGGMAVIGKLAIPEGARIAVPVLHKKEEVFVPIHYHMPRPETPLWSMPIVVAARMKHKIDDTPAWVAPNGKIFDEVVQVGIGVKAMRRDHHIDNDEELGEFSISLRSTQAGDEAVVTATRTIYLRSRSGSIVSRSKDVSAVPKDAQRDFLQLFRDAARESVSNLA